MALMVLRWPLCWAFQMVPAGYFFSINSVGVVFSWGELVCGGKSFFQLLYLALISSCSSWNSFSGLNSIVPVENRFPCVEFLGFRCSYCFACEPGRIWLRLIPVGFALDSTCAWKAFGVGSWFHFRVATSPCARWHSRVLSFPLW
jgi:hypothetical protein